MNKLPVISVIIATRNRPSLLRRAFESIIHQSCENKKEVIIINDGGEKYLDRYRNDNGGGISRLKAIDLEKNMGVSHTRNIGLENATGDYICFLDDDDIFLNHAFDFRMNMINKLKADIVYTRALQDIWETQRDGKYRSVGKQLYWDCAFDKDLILIQNIAPNCCVMFSKDSWNKSYWFDENLINGEDYDFWIALSRNNDFHELGLIDCECSFRKDEKSQKTGSENFANSYPIIYKRWRHTAIDLEKVTQSQNRMLVKMGFNPKDYDL